MIKTITYCDRCGGECDGYRNNRGYHVTRVAQLCDDNTLDLCQKCYDSLYDWLKKQNECKDEKWIPVSERLPEEDGRYLTYIVNKHYGKQCIMVCDYHPVYPGNNWFPDNESATDNVVAWMPLPKPYELQESEE